MEKSFNNWESFLSCFMIELSHNLFKKLNIFDILKTYFNNKYLEIFSWQGFSQGQVGWVHNHSVVTPNSCWGWAGLWQYATSYNIYVYTAQEINTAQNLSEELSFKPIVLLSTLSYSVNLDPDNFRFETLVCRH